MKTKILRVSFPALLLAAGTACGQPCEIENAGDVKFGVHKSIQGTCSNNGLKIICYYETSRRLDCIGPDGSFSGDDADNVIASACGCERD